MKSLKDYLAESEQHVPRVGDTVTIEIGFDDVIETYVVDVLEDHSVVVQTDKKALSLLESCGCIFEDIKRYGAVGSSAGMGHSLQESHMSEVDQIIQDVISGELDAYDIMTHPKTPEEQYVSKIIQQEYENVSIDHRLHGDDDFEKILDIVVDRLADDYGHPDLEEDQDAEVLAGKELAADITNPMPGVHENSHEAGEYDYEGDMAKDDLHTIIRAAKKLNGMLDDDENMPEWVQSKINKAADYVDTAADYIESNKEQAVGINEAEYQGRKVPLGKPMRGDAKKFKVYVKDPSTGNIKKVNFGHGGTSAKRAGQKTMKIKKSDPARRRSFRARHNCDNPGPRTKARYWSCRAW
jgi:hypothetical protein